MKRQEHNAPAAYQSVSQLLVSRAIVCVCVCVCMESMVDFKIRDKGTK